MTDETTANLKPNGSAVPDWVVVGLTGTRLAANNDKLQFAGIARGAGDYVLGALKSGHRPTTLTVLGACTGEGLLPDGHVLLACVYAPDGRFIGSHTIDADWEEADR